MSACSICKGEFPDAELQAVVDTDAIGRSGGCMKHLCAACLPRFSAGTKHQRAGTRDAPEEPPKKWWQFWK